MRLVKRRAKGGVQFSGRDGKRWAENNPDGGPNLVSC